MVAGAGGSSLRVTSWRESVQRHRSRFGWRWIALLMAIVAIFLGLRAVHGNQPHLVPLHPSGQRVVVVGVAGHYALTATDKAVLQGGPAAAQLGAVSIRPRYIGDCAAAGWTTLGAGRRTSVGGLCTPEVRQNRVPDWPQRLRAAKSRRGDAYLGTLAKFTTGCIMAVGPGASLAAARPDGSLAGYQSLDQFLSAGSPTLCPLTLVDAGTDSDRVIAELAGRPGVTVVLTGIGPPPGSRNPEPQVIYVLGAEPGGWLSSSSTRRTGVVTLTDLTRTLIQFGSPSTDLSTAPLDGAPIEVLPQRLSALDEEGHLSALRALSEDVLVGDAVLGAVGALLFVVLLAGLLRGRFGVARLILGLGTVLPAAMVLTGALPWNRSSVPGLALSVLVGFWSLALTAAAFGLAKSYRVPVAMVGAAITVAAFTVDAALGGIMQPGSMLNSRPVNGGRWYGFGNVAFATYAAAGLVLAAFSAHFLQKAGRPRVGLLAATAIGFGVVICDGWPTMGADFGGVLALTPGLVYLLLSASGIQITWTRMLALAAMTVAVATAISVLDWLRGPAVRSHLGAFVQRIIEGGAVDVVARKAIAAGESLLSPPGAVAVFGGIVLWILIFSRLVPDLLVHIPVFRALSIAALTTAILGTLLNDGGVSVWGTLTAAFSLSAGSAWCELCARPPLRPSLREPARHGS